MMRAGILLTVSLAEMLVTGCSAKKPDAIDLCEARVKVHLKAPATYKRISADIAPFSGNPVEYIEKVYKNFGVPLDADDIKKNTNFQNPPYSIVGISYDADNPKAVPIRSSAECLVGSVETRSINGSTFEPRVVFDTNQAEWLAGLTPDGHE